MDAATLRAWSFAHQGLDGSLAGATPAAALARTGWIRSVGGASPYLGLYARTGVGRAAVDAAVAALHLSELPSARGCTYVLPAEHYATGLRAGQGFGEAPEIATAKKHLGVTDAELDALDAAVLAAVAAAPLDPRQLKDALGDAVRGLGPEGKKRGQTTTLPLSLGRLQAQGRIRRVPLDGRLDRQRYAYVGWSPSPLDGDARTPEAVFEDLARLYFGWAGYATVAQLQAFAGIGAKAARAAVAGLGLVPLAPGDDRLASPATVEAIRAFRAPADEQIALVASLDGLALFRRDAEALFADGDLDRIASLRDGRAGSALGDLPEHAILDRGRVVGLWIWDAAAGEIAFATFAPPTAAIRAAVERTAAFVASDLGDARSFSLDAPEGRAARIAGLRGGFA